ncbi:MAG: hypothetical protein OJF51_002355 [Nitrospira sp.]|nr:MAG: hypothetical protein OJF51_002355 [Nitrospira sp.]
MALCGNKPGRRGVEIETFMKIVGYSSVDIRNTCFPTDLSLLDNEIGKELVPKPG